jgi:hypothetical protein
MKNKVIFALAFSLLIAALAACGSSDNTGTVSTTTTGSSSTPAPTPTTAVAKHFKAGDVVTVGTTWQVTVNSVNPCTTKCQDPKTYQSGLYNPPKKGEYLLLDVTVKNISSAEQNISSLINFKMTDSTGISYTETFAALGLGLPNPPDGKVEAGSPSRGTFTFDVPKSTQFTFAFTPDLAASGETIWDIQS